MALYTEAELKKKTVADLRDLLDEHDLEAEEGWKKQDFIDALLVIEESDDDELEDDELDDVEEDEEVDDTEDDEVDDEEDDLEVDDIEEEPKKPAKKSTKKPAKEPSGDTMAAKQVATELGTEAKTLRQFFRSPASTIEPVGSGGRYEFDKADLPKIKEEFEAWKSAHASRGSRRTEGGAPKRSRSKGKAAAEVEEIEEVEELDIEELELDDEIDDELED